jgi:hypothetical protein
MTTFDNERAQSLLGKYALIGLNYYDHDGTLLEQVQVHGAIVAIDADVLTIRQRGSGEDFTLPPDLDAFQDAAPGEYRLRTTGEVVVNPDVLAYWSIRRPAPGAADRSS